MNEEKNYLKCLHCEIIPCVNFLKEKGKLYGGELFLLNEEIAKNKLLPCMPGVLLFASCRLWSGARQTLQEGQWSPLLWLLWQCFYDLKASLFLALTGHYRTAIQLLRPIVENALTGLYFEVRARESETKEEVEKVELEMNEWFEGKRELKWEFLLEQLRGRRVLIDQKILEGPWRKLAEEIHLFNPPLTIERIKELWHQLNKFIHPSYTAMDISLEKKCAECPGLVLWDKKRYFQWLEFFQNIIALIATLLIGFFPQSTQTESGKEALHYFKSLEWEERELKIKAIVCPYMEEFLKTIEIEEDSGDVPSSKQ